MKKFLSILGVSILLLGGFCLPSFALPGVWTSSNTATTDTTLNLCKRSTRSVLHALCVNTGSAGTLTIYNSSGTATLPMAALNTAAVVPCAQYDVVTSSGLTYTNSGTANITILYMCY